MRGSLSALEYPKTTVFEYLRGDGMALVPVPRVIPCQNDSPGDGLFIGNLYENGTVRCSGSGTWHCPAFSLQASGERERPRQPEPQIRRRQKQTREKQGRSVVLTCVPSSSFTARCCRFEYASNVCTFSTYLAVFGSGFLFRAAARLFSKRV